MRKPVSARRQKQTKNQSEFLTQVSSLRPEQNTVTISSETNTTAPLSAEQTGRLMRLIQSDQKQLLEKIESLLLELKKVNKSHAETELNHVELVKNMTTLQKEFNVFKREQISILGYLQSILTHVEKVTLLPNILTEIQNIKQIGKNETKVILEQIVNELKVLKSIGREDYKTILNILLNKKQDVDTERTLSFQLGKTLIDSKKSIENLFSLPSRLVAIKEDAKSRKEKNIMPEKVKVIETIEHPQIVSKKIESKQIVKVPEIKHVDTLAIINKENPLIAYEYLKNIWPKTHKKARFISILDEISENSWANEFTLYGLNKNEYPKQIEGSTSNALFIESCWKGNKGAWEYAFTSPGLKHANAQKLLDALSIAKGKGMPIIFWNKEDPMHYEKFLPIAEKCDVIFTTDENKVSEYKKDLPNKKVYAMEFAANQFICNPVNRNRYEEETICFAGSYYSVGHDDRKVQMDQLLPALLEFNGAIYDRMSNLNNERYFFPEQYRHLIRNAVDFKTMSVLYKKFKIFLNVNTITDSPTMMSRRVYELLACGTPVISTPSLALEKQFPNIVQIAKDADDAVKIAKELLTDEWKYRHVSHLGYREVMLKHTYAHRVKAILASIDITYEQPKEKVSIIMATMREHFIDRILINIGRQNYENVELTIVTQNFSKTAIMELRNGLENLTNLADFKILEINTEMSLGARLNKAAEHSTGTYLAKMDDDDFYFENYLTDMIIPFSFGNFGLVGKKETFIYLEESDKTVLRFHNTSHRITDFVSGPTLVFTKTAFNKVGGFNDVNRGEDSTIIEKLKKEKLEIYASDPFNFIQWRGRNAQNHTWKVEDEFFLKNALVLNGFAEKEVIV